MVRYYVRRGLVWLKCLFEEGNSLSLVPAPVANRVTQGAAILRWL